MFRNSIRRTVHLTIFSLWKNCPHTVSFALVPTANNDDKLEAGDSNISRKLCAVSVPTVRKFSGFKFVDTALRREDFEDSYSRTSVGHSNIILWIYLEMMIHSNERLAILKFLKAFQ